MLSTAIHWNLRTITVLIQFLSVRSRLWRRYAGRCWWCRCSREISWVSEAAIVVTVVVHIEGCVQWRVHWRRQSQVQWFLLIFRIAYLRCSYWTTHWHSVDSHVDHSTSMDSPRVDQSRQPCLRLCANEEIVVLENERENRSNWSYIPASELSFSSFS